MRPLTLHEASVLDALVEVARPIILEEFNLDSCIATTRIGIDVLDYFGIKATALPISAVVFNKEALDLLTSGTSMEDLKAIMAAIPIDEPGGPWSIGVGAGGPLKHNDWAGHLIATIPEASTIIDLSIDQASRPHKNFTLVPYHAVLDEDDWWSGKEPMATFSNADGCYLLLDRRVPDPVGYLSSPNWKRTSNVEGGKPFKALTGRIIRAVKDAL